MGDRPAHPPDVAGALDLARRDPAAVRKRLGEQTLQEQLALLCEAPVQRRREILDLLPAPEEVIPLMPEAELCFTVKAIGLETATWILDHATPEQLVAAVDLDGWAGNEPAPARLEAWLDAIAETEDEQVLRTIEALDPELLVLHLKSRIAVVQQPNDDEGWQPPVGAQTLDGAFHFVALAEKDDLAAILRVLRLLFERDYWTYFRLLQGVIWELDTENEEWARRWRTGRLQDLGFPPWDEAIGLYGYLAPEERVGIGEADRPLEVGEWHLPVWIPSLPEGRDSRHLVFRSIARLEDDERRAAFYAFVGVANQVAVADHLELSDVETTPKAIEKAAVWIDRGLEFMAAEHRLDATEVLRRVPLARLFRVGANLDPEAARG